MVCSEQNCGKEARARGLCMTCYGRKWRAGDFGTPRPCCVEDGCTKRAFVGGKCRQCYSRWHREQNPELYARYNQTRLPARNCHECGAPVGKRARLCASCREAATKARANDRQRNRDTWRQIEKMRRAEKPGYGKRPATATLRHIGSLDAADVTLLAAVSCDPCCYCGGACEAIDHIEATSAGGAQSIENVTASCQACNSRKGSRTLLSFLLTERIDAELEPLASERRRAYALAM